MSIRKFSGAFPIMGQYDTLAELEAEHPVGRDDEGYMIQGDLWVWGGINNQWMNVGHIQSELGPIGSEGPPCEQGPVGE